jgi:hypothetical protein
MDNFAGERPLEVEELRAWLRSASDEELSAFGETARHRCPLEANGGRPPDEIFSGATPGGHRGMTAEAL